MRTTGISWMSRNVRIVAVKLLHMGWSDCFIPFKIHVSPRSGYWPKTGYQVGNPKQIRCATVLYSTYQTGIWFERGYLKFFKELEQLWTPVFSRASLRGSRGSKAISRFSKALPTSLWSHQSTRVSPKRTLTYQFYHGIFRITSLKFVKPLKLPVGHS